MDLYPKWLIYKDTEYFLKKLKVRIKQKLGYKIEPEWNIHFELTFLLRVIEKSVSRAKVVVCIPKHLICL